MGSFSATHWLIVLAVVLVLFGGKKIPELAKGLGQGIRNFKKEIKEEDSEPTTTAATTDAPKQVEPSTTASVDSTKTTTQA